MRRAWPLLAGIAFGLAVFWAQAVIVPGRVWACRCAEPRPLAQVVTGEQVAVIVGSVGQPLVDRTPITVETWFHGAPPAGVVWLAGGTQMASSCDISLTPGSTWVLVLYGGPMAPGAGGFYSAGSCDPHGMLGTAHGDAVLAEAIATFGAGQLPEVPEPEPVPAIDLSAVGHGLLWAVAASTVGLLVLGIVALVARRRA